MGAGPVPVVSDPDPAVLGCCHKADRRCIDLSHEGLGVDRLEQPPVPLYVAGAVIAVLAVFTGSFSYGRASLQRDAGLAAAAPAAASVGDMAAAGAGPGDGEDAGSAGTQTFSASNEVLSSSAFSSGTGDSGAQASSSGSGAVDNAAPSGGGGSSGTSVSSSGKGTSGTSASSNSGSATSGDSGQESGAGNAAIHVVAQGETLTKIARRYGVSVSSLRSANGLPSDLIKVGQKLTIPGVQMHTIAQGDSFWELSRRYGIPLEALLAVNSGVDPGHLMIGSEVMIPSKESGAQLAAAAPEEDEPAAASLAGQFIWPVIAPISSHFGPRDGRNHNGIDLAANMGDDIRAARDGTVIIAGEVSGYGNTVVLEHADGTRTLYAHASVLKVEVGQKVRQGDLIALVGSTGRSTGPHLHFEIIINDRPRDPLLYLPKR